MPLAAVLLGFVVLPSHAAPPTCRPVVRDAWIRLPPAMPMGAGFFTLSNPCATPLTLAGATSPRFGDVSMHETRVEQGISRMRPLAPVVVPARGTVAFAPGGRHLMLMAPVSPVKPGERVRVALRLADGRMLPVDFLVKNAAP